MPSYATTKLASLTPVYPHQHELILLSPRSSREATISRVEEYRRLFASRYTSGIVTRRGQGPTAWTAFRGRLRNEEIIHHLLADRFAGRPPVWYGSRSFPNSRYLCLDVDADRTPEQILAKTYPEWERMPEDIYAAELGKIVSQLRRQVPRPSFADRCSLVERAFRRMGINPDNPRSVLIQRTPSGGRHYYLFFDARYSLDQYHELLHAAGLKHIPGEIEFYPSPTHGLRLPFGLVPGLPHDPNAWIQFIDDYRHGQIIRHSLATLTDSLVKHRSTQHRRIQSLKQSKPLPPTNPPKPFLMGMPKQSLTSQPDNIAKVGSEQRFLALLDGIHSSADAEELLSMGILLPGTRTKVLIHLAAHLVWFKHLPAADAAQILINWSMSPRHASKDIADDLAHGTTIVANHIQTMCRWYEANKRTPDINPTDADTNPEFAPQELKALRSHLADLSPDDQANQAHFLLHFLRFAKRHGSTDSNGTGWLASPAVRQVIRRWPGCHHMNYATRISHAISGGCMEVVKESWHSASRPGRARTYRLSVPVIPQCEWVMTYEAALKSLTTLDSPAPQSASLISPPTKKEAPHASDNDRPAPGYPTNSDPGAFSSPLPSASSGTSLDSGPRQCHPQSDAAARLHRRDSQGVRTTSAIAAEPSSFGCLMQRFHSLTQFPRALFSSARNAASFRVSRHGSEIFVYFVTRVHPLGLGDDMAQEPANKVTVAHWLERVSRNRYAEVEGLYHQADTYWASLAYEIKLRVYQQFDFGGYHGKWLDQLWERHRHFPTSDQYDDPIEWFLTWIITPEQDGLYLDGASYLVDLEHNAGRDDAHEEGNGILYAFVERGYFPISDAGAEQLVSSYFASLVKVLELLLRLFVMQNADLMSNAPRFKRLFFMEREATLGILDYLKEVMKGRTEAAGNATASPASQ